MIQRGLGRLAGGKNYRDGRWRYGCTLEMHVKAGDGMGTAVRSFKVRENWTWWVLPGCNAVRRSVRARD